MITLFARHSRIREYGRHYFYNTSYFILKEEKSSSPFEVFYFMLTNRLEKTEKIVFITLK